MATLDSELALVKRFYNVSQKYETRPAVARRNTMPTLIRFLKSKEREIRKYALEAVYLLAQHPDNIDYLGNISELVDGVFKSYKEGQYDDPELCEKASLILDCLAPTFHGNDPRKQEVLRRATDDGGLQSREGSLVARPSRKNGSQETQNDQNGDFEVSTINSDVSVSSFGDADGRSTTSESSAYAVIEIPALNARTNMKDVEAILQRTPGVLSYTISTAQKQVKVFMTSQSKAPAVQQSLTANGYVNLLLKLERLGFVMEDRNVPSSRSHYDSEQTTPSYVNSAKKFASSLYGALMVYTTAENNTLASRIRRQRELESQGDSVETAADRVARAFARWW